VQIENHCVNAPKGLVRQVRRCLKWIEPADLEGIAFVCLMDQMPPNLMSSDSPHDNTYGWYHLQMENIPPYIVLYIPNIYSGIPSFLWRTTVPTLRISRSLAHEVAHHVRARRGSLLCQPAESPNEESFANEYAAQVLQRMTKAWSYRLGHWCIREIAGWYYAFGNVDWRNGKYAAASDSFFKAWDLDPQHKNAAHWYLRAKKMLAGDETAPTSMTSSEKTES